MTTVEAGRDRRESGFTLIEVIVALMVVALGMAGLLKALGNSATEVSIMREHSFAQWVALNQLATARLAAALPVKGKSEGDADFANSRWHWQQTVTAMQFPGIVRIEVSVRPAKPDNAPWTATVTSFRGSAVSTPLGTMNEMDTPSPAGPAGRPAPSPSGTPPR